MPGPCCDQTKEQKEFRNINAFKDLPTYRLPPAGIVSILHRISGTLLFFCLPFLVWLLDKSLTSDISYSHFTILFAHGLGFDPATQTSWLPAWCMKIVAVVLVWAYLHHFCAGIRHLYMDVTHKVTKEFGRSSALVSLAMSLILTLILALKIFGVY